ncbi:MAG TPA: glycosyltransferase [Acidimicrobiia bacterium]
MTDRKRVAILIKGLGIGGAERLISEAVEFWDRTRYDYRVAYLLPWKNQLVDEITDTGIPVAQLGNGRMGPTTFRSVRAYLAKTQPDIVHAHLPSTGIIARMLSGAPVVYTEHNVVSSYRQPTRSANRMTYGRNSRLIAVSEAVADSVKDYPGPDPVVIPNGVAISVSERERAAARAELEISDDTVLISHVGNIRPHKGHQNLIAAVQEVNRTTNNFLVVSIGGDKNPGDRERVVAGAHEAGIDGVFRHLGRREDALSFVAASDVFVNPSDHEGMPLAILEAMSLGVPVVATSVGGVPSVIENDASGLLVPAGDSSALATAMASLIEDESLRRRLGARGGIHARANHGLEAMIRSVESLYADLLADG